MIPWGRGPGEWMAALNPLVEELFRLMEEIGYPAYLLSERAGVSHITMSRWKHGGYSPRLFLFQATLEALGYRLKIEPIEGAAVERPELRPRGRRTYTEHWGALRRLK